MEIFIFTLVEVIFVSCFFFLFLFIWLGNESYKVSNITTLRERREILFGLFLIITLLVLLIIFIISGQSSVNLHVSRLLSDASSWVWMPIIIGLIFLAACIILIDKKHSRWIGSLFGIASIVSFSSLLSIPIEKFLVLTGNVEQVEFNMFPKISTEFLVTSFDGNPLCNSSDYIEIRGFRAGQDMLGRDTDAVNAIKARSSEIISAPYILILGSMDSRPLSDSQLDSRFETDRDLALARAVYVRDLLRDTLGDSFNKNNDEIILQPIGPLNLRQISDSSYQEDRYVKLMWFGSCFGNEN